MNISTLLASIFIGLGATLVLDLWAELLKHIAKVQPTNWCHVGRWFCHMLSGVLTHANIAEAQVKPKECAIGWVAHYLIGAVYGIALVLIVSREWLDAPTLLPALLFGLATIAFPFFIMQPAFGSGIAAAKAPAPRVARIKSLVSHLIFGLGLYVSALLIL